MFLLEALLIPELIQKFIDVLPQVCNFIFLKVGRVYYM